MNTRRCLRYALCLFAVATTNALADTREVLPIPQPPFQGVIEERATDSTPAPYASVTAPADAPNVFLMMSDDVGFAMSSAFGGLVPTPNFERIATAGIRYNRFHTTAICSPTRAALLTGRNHHNANAGYLTDVATGYPGYHGRISEETATIAQVLRLNGYNTAMFGKHHNTPPAEVTQNGPFDRWPTGLGFEYFYGYIGPEIDQFRPNLYRGTTLVTDDGSMRLLDARMADEAIHWLHNQQAPASGKPFFMYFSPSSTHEPHQAPQDYIDRFKGQFDMGWDKIREFTFQRQIEMGIIPEDTILTSRPKAIPAWASLTDEERAFAARSMEVAAAMLVYQDEQIGRVLSEMERIGVMDNTLVVLLLGDNGASGDQGLMGVFNRSMETNQIPESDDWRSAHLDELGGPNSYANYQAGWSWAMNTPLRWHKQYASRLGGIRNGMIVLSPGRIEQPGSVCAQFGHVVDIMPTILEAAQLPAPQTVYGAQQKALDGQSLFGSLGDCKADHPRTQYFEIGGKKGLWHNGWFAANDDGRMPWQTVSPAGPNPPTEWTLYNLKEDFSQATNLAGQHPEKLQELIALWESEAKRNQVYPLDHSFGAGRSWATPDNPDRYDFWGKNISISATTGPNFIGRSFSIEAKLDLDQAGASGVVMALGSQFMGWSLFLEDGKPTFVYALGLEQDRITRLAAPKSLPKGEVELTLTFDLEGMGKSAQVTLSSQGETLTTGHIPRTFFVPGGAGEMLDTGRDTGVPVTGYSTPHGEIEGDIIQISLKFH